MLFDELFDLSDVKRYNPLCVQDQTADWLSLSRSALRRLRL